MHIQNCTTTTTSRANNNRMHNFVDDVVVVVVSTAGDHIIYALHENIKTTRAHKTQHCPHKHVRNWLWLIMTMLIIMMLTLTMIMSVIIPWPLTALHAQSRQHRCCYRLDEQQRCNRWYLPAEGRDNAWRVRTLVWLSRVFSVWWKFGVKSSNKIVFQSMRESKLSLANRWWWWRRLKKPLEHAATVANSVAKQRATLAIRTTALNILVLWLKYRSDQTDDNDDDNDDDDNVKTVDEPTREPRQQHLWVWYAIWMVLWWLYVVGIFPIPSCWVVLYK